MKRVLYVFILMSMALFLGACGSGGNPAKKAPNTPSVTLGQDTLYDMKISIDNSNSYKKYSDYYYYSYQKKGTYTWSSEKKQSYEPIRTSITYLEKGSEYKVRVRVKNEAGYSGYGYSDYVQIGEAKKENPSTNPSTTVNKPTGVDTTYYKNLKEVSVSWDYEYNIDKYYISYQKQYSSLWSKETSTTSIRYTFTVGNVSGKHKFRVRAYKDGTYSDYAYSDYIDIEDTSTISTPTNLDVAYYGSLDKFSISWNDDYAGIDAYISWKEKNDYSWSNEKEILNAISYQPVLKSDIKNFKEGNSYKFRVRIKKDGAYSDYVESDYIQAGDKPKLTSPSNLKVNYFTYSDNFLVSWDTDYSFTTSYISWRKLGGSWSNEVDTVIQSKFIDITQMTGFQKGDSYKFRVRIKEDGVYSDYVESGFIDTE